MRTFGSATTGPAATAEGLTAAQAAAILKALPQADLAGMLQFIDGAAGQGADETAWRAAFSSLGPLTDPQVRFLMRVVAQIKGGIAG